MESLLQWGAAAKVAPIPEYLAKLEQTAFVLKIRGCSDTEL